MDGCTKRYTDPSSLRKHVKNHTRLLIGSALPRQKDLNVTARRSKKTSNTPLTLQLPKRCYSESSSYDYDPSSTSVTPLPTPNSAAYTTSSSTTHFNFDNFGEPEDDDVFVKDEVLNSMNFNEMTNCIETIHHNHHHSHHQQQQLQQQNQHYQLNAEQTNYYPMTTAEQLNTSSTNTTISPINNNETNDEFVSFECVTKLLGESHMDFIDATIQNHIQIDY